MINPKCLNHFLRIPSHYNDLSFYNNAIYDNLDPNSLFNNTKSAQRNSKTSWSSFCHLRPIGPCQKGGILKTCSLKSLDEDMTFTLPTKSQPLSTVDFPFQDLVKFSETELNSKRRFLQKKKVVKKDDDTDTDNDDNDDDDDDKDDKTDDKDDDDDDTDTDDKKATTKKKTPKKAKTSAKKVPKSHSSSNQTAITAPSTIHPQKDAAHKSLNNTALIGTTTEAVINEENDIDLTEALKEEIIVTTEDEEEQKEKHKEEKEETNQEEKKDTHEEEEDSPKKESKEDPKHTIIVTEAQEIEHHEEIIVEEFYKEVYNIEAEDIITLEDITKPNNDCLNPSFYKFSNGSCLAHCPQNAFIIQNSTDSDSKQLSCTPCDDTCAKCTNQTNICTACNINLPYLYSNHTCLATCPPQTHTIKILEGSTICMENPRLTPRQERIVEAVDNYGTVGGAVASAGLTITHLINHGSSYTAPTILIVNSIQHIKYFNINYSPQLLAIFENQLEDLISFNFDYEPSFPDSFEQKAAEYPVPERFARFNVYSLFIYNFFEGTVATFALGLVSGLIILLHMLIQKDGKFKKFLAWMYDFLIWNFAITFLLSNLNEVALFATLQYGYLRIDSALSVISFIICCVFSFGLLILLELLLIRMMTIRRTEYKTDEDKIEQNSKIKVLFEDLNTKHFAQEIFVILVSWYAVLQAVIIGAISSPTFQISCLIALSILMILYLAIFRPLNEGRKNGELIIYESLTIITYAFCLKLSRKTPEEQMTNNFEENAIIITDVILITFVVFFQVYEHVSKLKEFIAERKRQKILRQVVPVVTFSEGDEKNPHKIIYIDDEKPKKVVASNKANTLPIGTLDTLDNLDIGCRKTSTSLHTVDDIPVEIELKPRLSEIILD